MIVQPRGGGDSKDGWWQGLGKMTTSTRMTLGTIRATMPHSKVPSAALFCSKSSLLLVSL
jgi:hypothetical protein